MPLFPLPFLAAGATPQEWLLAFFALASFVLLGLWTIAHQRFRASVIQETRDALVDGILARFRNGMEARIGTDRSPAMAATGPDGALDDILSYANIAEALSGGYAGIFYIDVHTGAFTPFRSDKLPVALAQYTGRDYFSEEVQSAILAPVHAEDEPTLREAFRRDRILAATEGGRVFTIPYRYVSRGGGEPVWFLARATRVAEEEDDHLVIAVANVNEQMRRERGHKAREAASIAKLEELLGQSARSRFTLIKLATYQDADELRDLALRDTGRALGAVAVYLYRHMIDGTTPLVRSWFRTPQHDVLPPTVAQDIGSPDYLDAHTDIRYTLEQKEDWNPVWDAMLRRVGAKRFLAGLLRVEGQVWGHVGYLIDRDGPLDDTDIEQFREACALVQIGILRARILETRDTHQRQLVASARAANQAARAKTMFLATMSHEIRTPLNAVIGYSGLLNRPNLTPDEIHEYTSGISHSANALLALLNDILDLSKLEAGKVDMTGRCDLVKLFAELESLFHYRAVSKDLRLSHTIRRDFPVLRLSEEHLRQVLLNLIGNAVKFTDSGLVEWSAEAHEDGPGTVAVDIAVHDTGIGISPEKLKAIFDPFVQDSATRGGKGYGGTGLGLPIVKRLLEACGGTIHLESEPGDGTRALIHIGGVTVLPRIAAAPPAGLPPGAPPAAGGAPAPGGAANLRLPEGFRAVIVDDVPINLMILDLHVRGLGVKDIAQAASGEEALRAIAERKPNIVLTDMWMPGMSGADLAAEIRKDRSLDDVPIVAVTADNNAAATFDVSLFSGIVTKPVTSEKLRLALTSLVPAPGRSAG